MHLFIMHMHLFFMHVHLFFCICIFGIEFLWTETVWAAFFITIYFSYRFKTYTQTLRQFLFVFVLFALLFFAFLSIKSHTIRMPFVCHRITVAYHSYTVHIKSHSIPIRFLCHRITVAYHTYTFRIKSHTFRIQLAITSHTLELNQFILISSFFYSTFLFS